MSSNFDVIIVGLGAMGAAACYQLARRGAKVLGIDRYAPPHPFGSTHGESRITRVACGEGPEYSPLALRSNEIWRELERQTGAELLTQNGFAAIAGRDKRAAKAGNAEFLEITIAAAKAAGIDYEILDGKDFRKRFPAFNVQNDDAVYFDRIGGFLRPEACVETQLRLAKESGAALALDEQVLSFDEAGGEIRVKTSKGEYSAVKLILAAGPWLSDLIDRKWMPGLKVTRQVLCWFAVEGGAFPHFVPERFPSFVWQVPAPQIIYGFPALGGPGEGVKVSTEQYDVATTPELAGRKVTPAEQRALYEEYVEPYFPGLTSRCLRSEVCLYTSVPDSRFVIDNLPGSERVLVASPCSGHGFKHSAAIGEALAQRVLGEPHLDLSAFRFQP